MGAERLFDGAGDRTQRALVEDMVDASGCLKALGGILQIPFKNSELIHPFRIRSDEPVKVGAMSGRKIVEGDDMLSQSEECFGQMGADETGPAGDEPALGFVGETTAEGFVSGGHGTRGR
jgi:hypothetical protein